MNNYESLFSWRNFIGEHVLAHQDGTLSVAIEWKGVDSKLDSISNIGNKYDSLKSVIARLEESGIIAEFHGFRDEDFYVAENYLLYGEENTVRNKSLSKAIREEMAAHYCDSGVFRNKNFLILTTMKKADSKLSAIFPKKQLEKEILSAEDLLKEARAYCNSGSLRGNIINRDGWCELVMLANRPNYNGGGRIPALNDECLLYEQWIEEKPSLNDGVLKYSDGFYKTGLLYLYPDTDSRCGLPGLFTVLLDAPFYIHISQIVRPTSTKDALERSESSTKWVANFISKKGVEESQNRLVAESSFRNALTNNAKSYFNTVIITVGGTTEEEAKRNYQTVEEAISQLGGSLRTGSELQRPYWRYSRPCQGCYVPWSREDLDSQVAHMIPALASVDGDLDHPMILHKTQTGELVSKGFRPSTVNHSITAAMTGAGKGVQKCAEILQTYPLGIDWYILEIGTSYQWTVESVEGTYLEIDPAINAINPLPDVNLLDVRKCQILDIETIAGTAETLMFLLLDGKTTSNIHERAAAECALEYCYQSLDKERPKQPLLSDYLMSLRKSEIFKNDAQAESAKRMADNLESFLNSAAGRVFNQETNIQLHTGCFGVNLKKVMLNAPSLLRFYFVFIGLAFMQYAYAAGQPARVLLDEMHVLVKEAPDVASKLISGVSRMGRKDGAAIDLVSQETAEIEAVESAVINQTPYFNLLYRGGDWDSIAERLNMPDSVLENWKSWLDPVSSKLPYRECLSRIQSKYHHLRLTYPKIMMDISSSDDEDLVAKEFIGSYEKDFIKRLELLDEYRGLLSKHKKHDFVQEHFLTLWGYK
ncbi:hypothetical protein [Shewanella algae]|uniref:hypothetical protein n=1 Tax=Shewanella algae TaxID=38313 RepID=UPI0031F55EC0